MRLVVVSVVELELTGGVFVLVMMRRELDILAAIYVRCAVVWLGILCLNLSGTR